ncbi:unnamed protein product [Acanthoscelides obtectus]|uniref:Uncharacterized protein n=1 Tax=Acanthoscelides obtectus TaxID=200917 RepID=A0A9P0NU72_ACAOB|nr:unnamed protein product [Acanthoscelides obtectus]CAK1661096.1 hypothetical protein AOBTE_LOCUS22436 [Acanthoscelides obtectus]
MDKFVIRKKQEPVTCPCPHSPQASTSNVDAKEQDEAHDSDSASDSVLDDGNSDKSSTLIKKKKLYDHKYKAAREKHENLGKWIKPSSHGIHHFNCKICNKGVV